MKKNFYAKVLTLTLATSMVQVPAMATDLIDNNHAVKEETENNEEVKAEAPAVAEEVKAEAPVAEVVEEVKAEAPKAVEEVKTEAPVAETTEVVKVEVPETEAVEETKMEVPETEAVEEAKAEAPETEVAEEVTEEVKAEEENEAVEHKFGAWDFDEEKEVFVRSCADCDEAEESTEPAEVTALLAEIEAVKDDSEAVKALTQKAVADGVITEAVAATIDATMQVSVLDVADTAVTAESLKAEEYKGVLDTSATDSESTSIFYKIDGDTLYFKATSDSDGKMPNYENTDTNGKASPMGYEKVGWYKNATYTKVVFDKSIKRIGTYTLTNLNQIEEITINCPTAEIPKDAVLFSAANSNDRLVLNAASTIKTTDGWIRGSMDRRIRKLDASDDAIFTNVVMNYLDKDSADFVPAEVKSLRTANAVSDISRTDLYKSIATLSNWSGSTSDATNKLSNYTVDLNISDADALLEKAKGFYDSEASKYDLEAGVYPECVNVFDNNKATFMYTGKNSNGLRTLLVFTEDGQSGEISESLDNYSSMDYFKVKSTIGKAIIEDTITELPQYMFVTFNNLTDIYTNNETIKIPRLIWAQDEAVWTSEGTTLHIHDTADVNPKFLAGIYLDWDSTGVTPNPYSKIESDHEYFKDCNGEYKGLTGTTKKNPVTIRISTYEADTFESTYGPILKTSNISSAQIALIKEAYDSLGTHSKNQLARDKVDGTTTYKERIESLYGDAFKCGDNVTYAYSNNGTLTITGTGDMYTYTDSNKAPWDGFAVKNVVIDDAVTNVNAIPADAVIHASINSGAYQYAKANNAQFKADKLRVLCIGNSHTGNYTTYLNNIIKDLKADGLTANVTVDKAIRGSIGAYSGRNSLGANQSEPIKSQLQALNNQAEAYSKLKNNTYDLIIVQDYLESTVEGTDTFVPGMEKYIAKIKEIIAEGGKGTPEIAWFADWVDLRSAGQDNGAVYDKDGKNSPISNTSREEAYEKSLANIAAIEANIKAGKANTPDFIIHTSTMKQNVMSSYLGTTENEDTKYSLIEVDTTHTTEEFGSYFVGAAAMSDICNHYGTVIGNNPLNVANALTLANGPDKTGSTSDYKGAVDDKVLAIIKEAISSPSSYKASAYTEDPAIKVKEAIDAYMEANPEAITINTAKPDICNKLNAALTEAGITDYTVAEDDITIKPVTSGTGKYTVGKISVHSGYTFREVAFGDTQAPVYSGDIYDKGWTAVGKPDTTGTIVASWELCKNDDGVGTYTLKLVKNGSGKIEGTRGQNTNFYFGRFPWRAYEDLITRVEVGDGMQLGNLVLWDLANCKEVVFGKDVTLGNEVFYLDAGHSERNVDCNIYFTGKTTIDHNFAADATDNSESYYGAIRAWGSTKGQINVYYNVEATGLPDTNAGANKVVVGDNVNRNDFTQTKLIGNDTKQAIVIHPIVKVDKVAATCTATGNVEYYKSNVNEDELYSDADGKNLTTLADVTTAALDHDITYTANGAVITESCTRGDVEEKTYTVSITPDKTSLRGGGDVTLTVEGVPTGAVVEVKEGDTVLTAEADDTYKATLANANATHTFTLNVTIGGVTATTTCEVSVSRKKSSSSSSDTSAPTYGVSTGKTENGTISVTPAKAEAGETVTIKATPDSGYQLDKVTVKDKNNSNVKLTKVNDNEYTFTMPSGKVSVNATFVQKDAADDNQNNAGEKNKVIKLQIGSRIVTVDNEAVIYDVAPVIRNDRTLVPIRIVTETLGGKVDWNGVTKEVTLNIDGKEIKMTVGKTLEKYGVAPVIIDGRTFVPVRFVADELGATVAWDDATKTVTITKIEK